jgi:protein-disulfide isomerase
MRFLTRQNCLGSSWFRDSRPTQFTLLAACCFLVATAASAQTHDAKPNPPVATVSGQTIYEDELLSTALPQLMPLRTQEFEIKRKALDDLIQQKLLEAAAKKKGITADQLLAQEVDSKIADPSDAEIQGYYMAVRDRTKSSFAEIQVQLKQSLKQAHVQQARQDYMKRLRDDANVTVALSAPRVNVAYDPARVRGNPKAPIMIVEFSDYQCPYCHQAEPTVQAILAKYGDKVTLSYRDFPLRAIHDHAEVAAEASRCALEQGKFWEYHDQLFKSANLDKEALIGYAKDAKLDDKQFESCLTSEKYKAQIDKDLDEGRKAGINGTPAFFINGVALSGAQGQDSFIRTIDDELSRQPQAVAVQPEKKPKAVTVSISRVPVN